MTLKILKMRDPFPGTLIKMQRHNIVNPVVKMRPHPEVLAISLQEVPQPPGFFTQEVSLCW